MSVQLTAAFRVTKEIIFISFISVSSPNFRINVFEFKFRISLFKIFLGNTILSVYGSLTKVHRINVFEFSFWISLFRIILGNTILSLYGSLTKVQRIKVFEFNFWISLFRIILGNTILSEIFEIRVVYLYKRLYIMCRFDNMSTLSGR